MNFKVSVVICCYTFERLSDLLEAVRSVQAQSHKPNEIIVAVDQNQGLFKRLPSEFPSEVNIVLNRSLFRRSPATDNVGITYASGDTIAFIDDDAVSDVTWLERLLQSDQEPSVIAVGDHLVPM